MSVKLIFCLTIFKLSSAQLNGEFWWLNDKVKQLKGIEPPQPAFEELSDFDTDESSKIIFRDEELPIRSSSKISLHTNVKYTDKENTGNVTKYRKPDTTLAAFVINNSTETVSTTIKQTGSDYVIFKFPDDDNIKITGSIESTHAKEEILHFPDKENFITAVPTSKTIIPVINKNVMTFKFPTNDIRSLYNEKLNEKKSDPKDHNPTEKKCIYMNKRKCYDKNGDIYISKTTKNKDITSSNFVCCIISSEADNTHKIFFPDSPPMLSKRIKRSNIELKTPINQREFLLRRKFASQNVKPTPTNTKIVTSVDDYDDPYWNIRNFKFNKNSNTQTITKPDCNYHDYVEDYVAELPKPGLVGIYSDHGHRPLSWTNINEHPKQPYGDSFDYSYEDKETSFGYSTVDPRKGTSSKAPKRKRPIKITTSSPEDTTFDAESQTINFQSNPNFQVLQGFKLLNLARDKNTFYLKNTKRSTTEASIESDSNESIKIEADGGNFAQVYEDCGSITALHKDPEISAKATGEAEIGSHPWLAIVVSTISPQSILCYATIVHPRLAITAGDCVSDYAKFPSPKEDIAIVTGLHDSKEKSEGQDRIVSILMHPRWRRESLAHNLAILHWTRPLRLTTNVQPACLTNYLGSGDCKFYGWGGFDQAMRQRPRWQRASVISPHQCRADISKVVKLPIEAFCVTVQTRGTVTGPGGSLICNIGGRAFSTGVAVYRDNALVLIPAHEWIHLAMKDLNIDYDSQ